MSGNGRATLPRVRVKALFWSCLTALVLVLSGCAGAVTEEIWLYGGERWKVDLMLSLNQDERTRLGDAFQDEDFEEFAERAAEEGISFDWNEQEEPDGGATYSVSMAGQGLDKLNEATLDGEADLRKDASGHIHLIWWPTTPARVRRYVLTINGGEIISSNADSVTDSSATWYDPSGRIEVELTEGGDTFTAVVAIGMACACLAGLVAVGGVLVFVFWRRGR